MQSSELYPTLMQDPMMIVTEPGALDTADVIVRVLSRCDLKAHLIKETHCNNL